MSWSDHGCEVCRKGVLSGSATEPEHITVNIVAHAALRRCRACKSYWIENEREAHAISEEEARRTFPNAFA